MATQKKPSRKTRPAASAFNLEASLEKIRRKLPPLILVGGNNDFLVTKAWALLTAAIEQSHPSVQIEPWPEGADLARVAESYRTSSLFSAQRVLLVPEVNAFVTARELDQLVDKATKGWDTARTDRKRKTSSARLMHALGLAGLTLQQSNAEIIDGLGSGTSRKTIGEMLDFARQSGGSASRGEADAAILGAMITEGGAPGAHLAIRTGEIPASSATVDAIEKGGVVIRCDLSRQTFDLALQSAIDEVTAEWEVIFEPQALSAIRDLLRVDGVLQDKYSSEIPDLALVASEIRRLAAFAGVGARVTSSIVTSELQRREGGARFEMTSLVSEGKPLEAIEKLRDLVIQAKREKTSTPEEFAFGSFVPILAEEIRVLVAIASWCRLKGVRSAGGYTRFRDTMADALLDDLESRGLLRKRMHPFPLYKKFETVSSGRYGERTLLECLRRLSEIEMERKSGGVPVQIGIETALITLGAR